MTSRSVSPPPSTAFAPPVYERKIVGIRTSTAIIDDFDFFLGYVPVNNSERPKFHRAVDVGIVTRRHKDVVRSRLLGEGDVGAGRICLGRRVRVVDDDRLFVA